jgi:hypothetical protein
MLARVAIRDNDLEEAAVQAGRARALADRYGDARLAQMPVHILACTAGMAGDLATARALAAEAIKVHNLLGDARMLAAEKLNLAHLELNAENVRPARDLLAAAREQLTEAGADEMLPEIALGWPVRGARANAGCSGTGARRCEPCPGPGRRGRRA